MTRQIGIGSGRMSNFEDLERMSGPDDYGGGNNDDIRTQSSNEVMTVFKNTLETAY